MPARGLFYGTSLGRDCFFLRLSLFPGARIDVRWQMQNPWPSRTHLSFIRFRVRIHLYEFMASL
jgi:hypothetical protein